MMGSGWEGLKEFVEDLLGAKMTLADGNGKEGTLVDQILSQLSVLQTKISSLLSTSSSGQGYELQQFRLTALRAEQNKLAGILALIAEGGKLGRGQIIRVLKWLTKVERMDAVVGLVAASVWAAWKPLEVLDASDARYDVSLSVGMVTSFMRIELMENEKVAEDWCHDIKFLKLASSLAVSHAIIHEFVQTNVQCSSKNDGRFLVFENPSNFPGPFSTYPASSTMPASSKQVSINMRWKGGCSTLSQTVHSSSCTRWLSPSARNGAGMNLTR